MKDRISALMSELEGLKAKTAQEVEELRIKWLGKKGYVTVLFEEFKNVAPEQKRELGQVVNRFKTAVSSKIDELKGSAQEGGAASDDQRDLTMPGDSLPLGSRHPITKTRNEIISIFNKFGYMVAEGPEIEDDWHVFGALNFALDHPARDMQDTFFISSGENPVLLRTHTSSVQVRAMETMDLPIRIICPGRVFRNEAISARAH